MAGVKLGRDAAVATVLGRLTSSIGGGTGGVARDRDSSLIGGKTSAVSERDSSLIGGKAMGGCGREAVAGLAKVARAV